jgi:hypothetical protein
MADWYSFYNGMNESDFKDVASRLSHKLAFALVSPANVSTIPRPPASTAPTKEV